MSRWYGDCIYGTELYKGVPETPEGLVNLFAWEPNWANGIAMKYRYNTIITRTRLLAEQRKPILSKPLRTQVFSVLFEQLETDIRLEGYLKKYHAKQILTPIYTEPVLIDRTRLTTTIDNQTILPVNTRIANCYNFLNWSLLCVAIDFSGTLDAELLKIKRIYQINGEWSIELYSSVQTAIPVHRVVLYPIYDAVLNSKTLTDHTDSLTVFECEMKEIFLYGI